MLKRLTAILLVLLMLTATAAAEYTLYVNNPNPDDRLNLRKHPDKESVSQGKYYNGAAVTVLQSQGDGWAEVVIGSGNGEATGWMMNRYLSEKKPDSVMEQYVTTQPVTACSRPQRSYFRTHSLTIEAGRRFSKLGIVEQSLGNWWHIKVYTDTSEGPYYAFVSENDLILKIQSLTPEHGVNVYISNPDHRDRLHLREEANLDSRSLGKYYNGCVGKMIGFSEDGEWLHVQLYGRTGWMKSKFLCIEGQRNNAYYGIPTVQTIAVRTPVYAEPVTEQNNQKALLERGTMLNVLGVVEKNMLHIQKEDGSTYFVSASDTNFSEQE